LFFILSLFASYIVGKEFTDRTIDNEIRIGYSRLSIILTRFLVVLPLTVVPYLAYSITCSVVVGIMHGIGQTFSVGELLVRFLLFSLQVMSIQSISMFVMFASRKASFGMMINVGVTFVTCNYLRNVAEDNVLFRASSFYRIMMNFKTMTMQELLFSFASAILMLVVMVYASFVAFNKADLR